MEVQQGLAGSHLPAATPYVGSLCGRQQRRHSATLLVEGMHLEP